MKRCLYGLLCICILLKTAVAVPLDMEQELAEYWDSSGAAEIIDVLPPDAAEWMEKQGMDSPLDIGSMTVSSLWDVIWGEVKESIQQPARVLYSLVAAILVAALLKSISNSFSSGMHQVFQVIVSVFVVALLLHPIIECILSCSRTFHEFSLFLAVYIPVFSGIITSTGQPLTGAAYNILLFSICQIISQVLQSMFVPMISCFLSLAIVSEVCPQMGLSDLVAGIKKIISWVLGCSMTLFLGLLTIQSVVASGGDQVAVKTTKFFISSMVPVVGGTLSDLFVATQGCLRLLKSTVGVFGIITAMFTFLPTLIPVVLWNLLVQAASVVSAAMGISSVSKLLKSIGSALGIILAVILYYALLFIVSTTLMILAFKGG